MNTFINSLSNISKTDKGALTHKSSLNKCLDLFFIAGASRFMADSQIIKMFKDAYGENPVTAMMILFWARDCRGGAGEKKFFRIIAKEMLQDQAAHDVMDTLTHLVPEYGSWKDLTYIECPNDATLNMFHTSIADTDSHSLAAKWFPRKGPWFVAMHKYLGVTPKYLRKMLVEKTSVVESAMCSKRFDRITYSAVPSLAMNKYRQAFYNQDADRFEEFNNDVKDGKNTVNASVLFPHQLFQALQKNNFQFDQNIENQWNALPDYMDSSENILPLCDVSGSMMAGGSVAPMDVSVALGVYIAERNKGPFGNHFMTFSEQTQLVKLHGETSCEKMINLRQADWGYTTNLQRAFEVILERGKQDNIKPEDMPTKILIISDMEFDDAGDSKSNLEVINQKYADSGYSRPEIIFWNVHGRPENTPAKYADKGIGLVSGFSPSILKAILLGKVETPYQLMLNTLYTKRYEPVAFWLKTCFGHVYDFTDVEISHNSPE
tara:strand:+ start:3571 stop:5043 length:1473 start_codon:yes stop_codon:yes gene_type:complete